MTRNNLQRKKKILSIRNWEKKQRSYQFVGRKIESK